METTSICMQGAQNLACAVIKQAICDYAAWYRLYLREPSRRTAKEQCRALEEFFDSPMFDMYAALAKCNLHGPSVAEEIRHDVRQGNPRRLQSLWHKPWQQDDSMEEVVGR